MKKWLLEKRWRIVLSGTLIVTAPILGLALFVYIELSGHLHNIINEENNRAALNVASHIESELQGDIRNGGLFTTRLPLKEAVRQRDRKKITRHLKDFVDHISSFERAFVADPKGIVLANYSEDLALIGKNVSDRDWYKGVSRNWQPYVSEFYLRAGRPQKHLFAVALPIKDIDNSIIGVLVLQASENYIKDAIAHIPAPKNQKVYVVDKKGNLIFHPDYHVDRIIDFTGFPSIRKAINGQSGVELTKNPDGAAMLTAYRPVSPWGWGVVVQRPEQEVYAPLRKLTFGLFAFTAIMIAIGASLAYRRSETLFSLKKLSEELEKRVVERTAELSKTNRVLKTLSECNQALVRAEDESALTGTICRIITEFGGYRMALVGYAEQDGKNGVRLVAQSGYEDDFLEKTALRCADGESGKGPICAALRIRDIAVFNNIATDEYPAAWREAALKRGYASAIGLPLSCGNGPFGALAIYSINPDAFDAPEIELLKELACDMVYGISAIRTREAHKAAAEALQESEEKYRKLVDHSLVGIYKTNLSGDIFYANKAAAKLFEFDSPEAMMAEGGLKRYKNPGDRERLLGMLRNSGRVEQIEFEVLTRTGKPRTIIMSAVKDGNSVSGMLIDITERKLAEEALCRAGRMLATASQVARVAMWEWDFQDNSVEWSDVVDSMLGYESGAFPRTIQAWEELIHPEDRPHVMQTLEQHLEQGTPYDAEYRVRTKNGPYVWWHDVGSCQRNAQGKACRMSGACTDITGRKQAEEAAIARKAAEEANRAKSDFLANMSHELRTPLNAVIGFAEILEDGLCGSLNEKQLEYVKDIASSGQHLLSLINDILDLAKVESGKLRLEPAGFPLMDVLNASMTMLKEKAMKHGIKLGLESGPDAAIEIEADERKLKQVMFNLLSNAVKFTPDGGSVRVSVRRGIRDLGLGIEKAGVRGLGLGVSEEVPIPNPQQPTPDRDFVEISVSDTGIGIKQEDIPKLFHEFTQLESAYTRDHEGTGLGLALSKKLVELHGGRIWVESEFGRGSRFTFVIPIRQNSE